MALNEHILQRFWACFELLFHCLRRSRPQNDSAKTVRNLAFGSRFYQIFTYKVVPKQLIAFKIANFDEQVVPYHRASESLQK
jgi:hypothetical protein